MKNKILWILVVTGLFFAATIQSVQAAGDAAAGKIRFYTCKGCHGIPGYSNGFPNYRVPSVGGQHSEYLMSVLKDYASGKRTHASMQGNAQSMSQEDMINLAAYISSYKGSPAGAPVKGDHLAGKKNANMPACASCHGADGNSSDRNNPRLAGQYEDYLVKALKDYKAGERKNPIMEGIAKGLSDKDINDLAAFFANQKKALTPITK